MESAGAWFVSAVIVAVEAVAYAIYARGILRGAIRPSRATWLIWAVLLWLTVASSWQGGAGAAVVKTVAMAFGVTAIAVLALRFGTGGCVCSDRACFGLTAVGIGGWTVSADPIVGLALFILTDAVGAIPTIRDLLRDPDRERPAYWLLCSFGCVLTLALVDAGGWSLSSHGFAQWSYPAYLLAVNLTVLLAQQIGRRIAVRQR